MQSPNVLRSTLISALSLLWCVSLAQATTPAPVDADLVRHAQELLTGLGYQTGPADGVMGTKTRLALKRFQEGRGIPVTGELDSDTRSALGLRTESRDSSPAAGGFDSNNFLAQRRLSELGYDVGPVDGLWSEKLAVAVRKFQEHRGSASSGVLDDSTMAELGIEKVPRFVLLEGTSFGTQQSVARDQDNKTDITIKHMGGTLLELNGKFQSALGAQGRPQPLDFEGGAIHHLVGRVELGREWAGFVFVGDAESPLTFRIVSGVGYVYLGGKGKVTEKATGETTYLGGFEGQSPDEGETPQD